MKKSIILVLMMLSFAAMGLAQEKYGIMRMDFDTIVKGQAIAQQAPRAPAAPSAPLPRGSVNLINYLKYIPSARNQGSCGNCWAWAGTGCLEIALNVQMRVYERLSVQFITSCETSVIGKTCCDGGWLWEFADFYKKVGYCIPWTNKNAYYQDGDASCDTRCDSIETAPNFPITLIENQQIVTREIGKESAIANIKSVLNLNKAIWFTFYLPTDADWDAFYSFWSDKDETAIWNPDFVCDKEWSDAGGGGHAVLCVGYNDDDPNNRYWIMLNSWGTANGKRPNGFFRLSMDINYDCKLKMGSAFMWALLWENLKVTFQFPTPTPTPVYEPGDNCLNPLAAGEGIFKGATTDMHHFYDPSRSPLWKETWSLAGPECVYKVNIPNTQTVKALYAKITSASFDNALYVMRDCSNPAGSLLAYADANSDKTGEMLTWAPDQAGDVYVVVDSYNPNVNGTFSLQISLSGISPQPTPTATPSPTPPPTPVPSPTPNPNLKDEEFIYEFVTTNNYPEGWKSTTVSLFSAPRFVTLWGKIGFSANGSPNCYGSWESPYHKFTKGQTYKAIFKVWSSIKDPKKVPAFRFRVEDSTFQTIATLNVNSLGTAETSPTDTVSQTYELIYRPSNSAWANGYHFTFDLINFGTDDDPNAQILLDSVEIKKVAVYP